MIKRRKYCNKKGKLLQSLPNVQKSPFHNSDTPSIYPQISDNHRADLRIEPLYNLRSHHRQVLTQRRVYDFNEQCLVFYKLLASIRSDSPSHDPLPRVDDTLLQQRSFKPLRTKIFIKQVAYRLHFPSEHTSIAFNIRNLT